MSSYLASPIQISAVKDVCRVRGIRPYRAGHVLAETGIELPRYKYNLSNLHHGHLVKLGWSSTKVLLLLYCQRNLGTLDERGLFGHSSFDQISYLGRPSWRLAWAYVRCLNAASSGTLCLELRCDCILL